MGFKDRVKQVFSTGQASAIGEARRLHKGGDIVGAVSRLKETLDARTESGKALAVIRQLHEAYSDELNLRQLRDYRPALAEAAFDLANYDRIENIMTSLARALRDHVYSGKVRAEAESLYKEFHRPFQKLQLDAQRNKRSKTIKKIEITDPEKSSDEFIALVEELHDLGGSLPEEMHSAYQVAQERSYILPDNLKEFDNYVIERRLGGGGFASVFLASPKGVSFQAAIKIFSPQPSLIRESGLSLAELKERFRREAGIMLSLSAEKVEGIVNARVTRTWQGKPYLFMDYYPANLSALIGPDVELLQTGSGGYLGYDKALPIISDILTSMHGLHNRPDPIIHRDLKPTNILLDANNRPYIGDFGLAREASRADLLSKAFQTVTGTNLATQYYGAPEQRGGFKDTDQRADIFSLGVLIFRILTGRLLGFHDLEPVEHYVQGLGKDMALKINDVLSKATRVEVDQRLSEVSTLLKVFSPQAPPLEVRAVQSEPAPEEQFLTALEVAYAFARDGRLPENVRATLLTKARELGIGQEEAEVLENDFRSRHGLSGGTDEVVSATSGTHLKSGADQREGTLIITSEPEMAEVIVDGLERGKTPLRIATVHAGKKSIRLDMPGFFPATRIELIEPDKEAKIHVILEPQKGSIKVAAETFSDAYPPRFYLDGKLIGRAPLTVQDVMAGSHTYKCEADSHGEVSGEIMVTLDEEATVSETLDPLHGKLSIASVPDGAAIWIDGKNTGEKTDAVMEVMPGKHVVTVMLDGHKDEGRDVEVGPEEFLDVEFRIEKENSFHDRFIDYGNGAVKDNKTGLEWLAGPDKDTNWNEAKTWVKDLNLDSGGWRMPTLDELKSIYEEGVVARNMPPMLKTTGWGVWSGEPEGSSRAMGFHFEYGMVAYRRDDSEDVRGFAVRSRNDGATDEKLGGKVELKYSPPPSSTSNMPQQDRIYVAYANGVVRDKRTSLEWKVGPDTDWKEAKAWVQWLASMNLDGGGWRMPTIDELEGLYVKGFGSRNMMPLLKTTGWWVWSGETEDSSDVWIFGFAYGNRGRGYRNHSNGTFAVRSRKDGEDDEKLGGKNASKYRSDLSSKRIEADYYYELGRAAFSSDDMNGCIENMTSAIAADEDNQKAVFYRACAAIKSDNSSSAKSDFIQVFSDNTKIKEFAGFWAKDIGYRVPAEELKKLFPKNPKVHYFLGHHYGSMDFERHFADDEYYSGYYTKDAFQEFTKAIEIDPEFYEAYCYRSAERPYPEYDEKIEDYSMAIKLNPSFAEAYYGRAGLYEDRDEYVKAIDDMNKCIELEPANSLYQNYREGVCSRLTEIEDSIKDLSERIDREPNKATYYRARAENFTRMKDIKRAILDYSKAIELSPSWRGCYKKRALLYEKTKDYQKAIDDCSKAIELGSYKPINLLEFYGYRAELYTIIENYELAIKDWSKCIEINPLDKFKEAIAKIKGGRAGRNTTRAIL